MSCGVLTRRTWAEVFDGEDSLAIATRVLGSTVPKHRRAWLAASVAGAIAWTAAVSLLSLEIPWMRKPMDMIQIARQNTMLTAQRRDEMALPQQ